MKTGQAERIRPAMAVTVTGRQTARGLTQTTVIQEKINQERSSRMVWNF